MPTRSGRTRWILAGLGALAVIAFVFLLGHRKPVEAGAPQSVPVTVARAVSQDFPVVITALGAAQAWKSVTILAQVSGILNSVNFTEGSFVNEGQVLAQVDPSTYQAALTQAQGQLRHDEALLAQARIDLKRYQILVAQDSIATQIAQDQAQLVKQDEGTVLLDQGSVRNAEVNLSRTRIVSPITGRAGVRLVDPGNLVSASGSISSTPATAAATNSTTPGGASGATTIGSLTSGGTAGSGIVVINQLQPIAITFTVPQGDFQELQEVSDRFTRPLTVQAFSQDSGALLDTGQLLIADNRVDPATGTVELKANFPNPQQRLWPGQFVNVRLTTRTIPGATLVPTTALTRGPHGQLVFVVGADGRATARPVTPGASEGQVTLIRSGIRPGELVVTDGQMTLKNGSEVRVAQVVRVGAAS